MEREEKERSAEHVQTLTDQLMEVTENSQTQRLELGVLKAEHKNVMERHHTLQHDHETVREKLDSLMVSITVHVATSK